MSGVQHLVSQSLPGRGATAKLTIILFIQTLEHQSQFFLMILEVMYKLFKVQLPIKVLVTCLHNFLENQSKDLRCYSLASYHHREITVLHNDPRCPISKDISAHGNHRASCPFTYTPKGYPEAKQGPTLLW